jgi:hypothetical protein
MTERYGVPARELSDAELEREGVHAHATRHWVFLHGTAGQFRTHTDRMLELEQEYLRRHPQRTWQGTGGSTGAAASALAREVRIRDLVQTLTAEIHALLDDQAAYGQAGAAPDPPTTTAQAQLLARFAEEPGGALHKLEAHQVARQIAPNARLVASLYKQDPPLLRADGDLRVLTQAGRDWLAQQQPTTG